MAADVACARCGETGLAHYWPEPGEPGAFVKRAWLSERGVTGRCCSRCMVELANGR